MAVEELNRQIQELQTLKRDKDDLILDANNQLTSLRSRAARNQVSIILRYKLDRIEAMSQPEDLTEDEWEEMPKKLKWQAIYDFNNNTFIFYEFLQQVKPLFGSVENFFQKIEEFYSIINGRIDEYIETGDVSESVFDVQCFNDFASILHNTTVN